MANRLLLAVPAGIAVTGMGLIWPGCGAGFEDDETPDDDAAGDDDAADDDAADDDADDDAADDDATPVDVDPPGYSGTNGFAVLFDDGTLVEKDGVVDGWVNGYGQLDLRLGVLSDLELHIKGVVDTMEGQVEWTSSQNDGTQVTLVVGAASGLQGTFGTTLLHSASSTDTGGTATWDDPPEASGHTVGTVEGVLRTLDGAHYGAVSAAFDTDLDAH